MASGRLRSHAHRSSVGRGLLCAGLVLVSTAVGVSAGRTAPGRDPPLVGAVQSGSGWRLRPLDPATLEPLPGGWSRRVGGPSVVSLVRSPLATGVVAAGSSGAAFLDSRTGRALRPAVGGDDTDIGAYWFGGERFLTRGGAKLLGAVTDCGSFACWADYFDITLDDGDSVLGGGVGYFDDFPWGVFPCGLISAQDGEIRLVHATGRSAVNGIESKTLLRDAGAYAYSRYAGDVAHDRLFVLTDDGTIAEIDHVCGRPHIEYHHVALNGKPFKAAWAGHGQIELLGEDGLGTIDTRTWTTHALAADVRDAVPTPYGIVVQSSSGSGVSVYRPEGGRRFTALRGMTIDNQTAPWGPPTLVVSGRYLYVLAGGHRYTVDLTDGRVLGRARGDARLALPSYVPLP